MFIGFMIALGALITAFLVAMTFRFANEAFSFGLDDEDPYIFGFVALFCGAGFAALLHFWLGVPTILLFLATPITTLVLLAAGAAAIWMCTIGFSKLDAFVVAQGRHMRDRLTENQEDRNA